MLRTARNLAFVIMLFAFVAGTQQGVFANWDSFCMYWEEYHDCSCSGDSWAKVVHCDFSGEKEGDWQGWYENLWLETFDECDSYCESWDYAEHLSIVEQFPANCFETWGNTSGQGSETDSWTRCDCSWFNWCNW